MTIIITDGGTKNNDSPDRSKRSSYGSFLVRERKIRKTYQFDCKTNNQAEYHALIKALQFVDYDTEDEDYVVYTDSQLVIKQMMGTWKCKNKDLQPLHEKATKLLNNINHGKKVALSWMDNKAVKKELGH